MKRTPPRVEPVTDAWEIRSGLDLHQVEALLDWLEVCGYTRREMTVSEDQQTFTVRWKR